MARVAKAFVFEERGNCPFCKKTLLIRVKKEVTRVAVAGQTKLTLLLEKDDQKKI